MRELRISWIDKIDKNIYNDRSKRKDIHINRDILCKLEWKICTLKKQKMK